MTGNFARDASNALKRKNKRKEGSRRELWPSDKMEKVALNEKGKNAFGGIFPEELVPITGNIYKSNLGGALENHYFVNLKALKRGELERLITALAKNFGSRKKFVRKDILKYGLPLRLSMTL